MRNIVRNGIMALMLICAPTMTAKSQTTDVAQSTLPSAAVSEHIRSLPELHPEGADLGGVAPKNLIVNEKNKSPSASNTSGKEVRTAPFVLPNSMIVQFEPGVKPEEVERYLSDNNLVVIQKFDAIGAVQVKVDVSKYFKSNLSDKTVNDSIANGLYAAVEDFKKDPRISSATPNLVLTEKVISDDGVTNMFTPSEVVALNDLGTAEFVDWGIRDIEAEPLWAMGGAYDGVIVGVMDVGFSRHDDITFIDYPDNVGVHDHGNHVAGIACGLHDGKGMRGVVPKCFVRAAAGVMTFKSKGDSGELNFMVSIAQILAALNDFVSANDDVRTFNISLGYNWQSNFGIDPDSPGSSIWRSLVETQGVIFVSILEAANRKGKIIYSAAGNDSLLNQAPTSAQYASPFNWAAINAKKLRNIHNGIIVGAHDEKGRRAYFSNKGADISCPGVNIMSTVAYDGNSKISRNAYGRMSGTSMAAPYCAGAHALFALVRPGYSNVEIANCLIGSGVPNDAQVPMVRLSKALQKCPAITEIKSAGSK